MLFAHGPAGFLTAYFTRKIWKADKLPKRTQYWMYLVGFIGGLFPDIDLFYYYLGSARLSHRQLFTHSIITYVLIFLIIYLIGSFYKKQSIKSLGIVFFFGNLSHLLLDMIYGATAFFAPLSKQLIGLPKLAILHDSFYSNNLMLVNFIIESLIGSIFLIILAGIIFKKKKIIRILRIIIISCFIALMTLLVFINNNVMTISISNYYIDKDKDGISNGDDNDMDGDNMINIEDDDIDGNNLTNAEDLEIIINKAEGNWYDISENGLIEIPYRMGFHNDISLVTTIFLNMGINFDEEMTVDYYINPEDYSTTPEDPKFDRNKENIIAWLKHKDKFLSTYQEIKLGDILFLSDGRMAIAVSENEMLIADKETKKIIKNQINNNQINNIGRILNIEQN